MSARVGASSSQKVGDFAKSRYGLIRFDSESFRDHSEAIHPHRRQPERSGSSRIPPAKGDEEDL